MTSARPMLAALAALAHGAAGAHGAHGAPHLHPEELAGLALAAALVGVFAWIRARRR